MEDLRLVGVQDDGQYLVLTDGGDGQFRLPLDDTLRAAARRDRARVGQLQIELDGGLRPREVQALIRAGYSAQEVADRAGWTVEKVHKYEGPILAEREHVAGLAQGVRLRHQGRIDGPALLVVVNERLQGRGVDPADAVWDAARDANGQWTVSLAFTAGGRDRKATWLFDLPARTVAPRDDEAKWLSAEQAPSDEPIPHHPTSSARPTTVYDIESDGGVDGPKARRRASHEPIDLMAAMRQASNRSRRSRRPHQPTLTPIDDAPRDDALPLEPTLHDPEVDLPPAARGIHPLDVEPVLEPQEESGAPVDEEPEADPTAAKAAAARTPAMESPAVEVTAASDADDSDDSDHQDHEHATAHAGQQARRGRTRVPAWEDIMFGSRSAPATSLDTDA